MEKERLKLCIERYDHYYDSVNNKSGVFLALSTFVVGGLVTGYPALMDKVNCSLYIHALVMTLIILGLAIMITVILSSIPFLSKRENSLLYFASVRAMSKGDFDRMSRDQDSETELADLRSQVYFLAKGLTSKFSMLKTAGMLFLVQVLLFIPLTIAIILNLK